MKTIKIDPKASNAQVVQEAVATLEKGGVILYPTDTIYGLGVDVANEEAMNKIYRLKGRDISQPVSFMAHDVDQIEAYQGLLDLELRHQLDVLFPGKITALLKNTFKKSLPVFSAVRNQKKIGWRIPDHPFCLDLCATYNKPVSTTSANRSGSGNLANIREIISQLEGKPDLVIDAGILDKKKASTIIDFTKDPLMIVRQGEVKKEDLQDLLPGQRFRFKKSAFEIVFVCSGNVCRSPMAEGILKALLAKTRFKNVIHISSAGTLDLPPTPVHKWAEKVSAANEINIHSHISGHMNDKIMDRADLVVSMAANHLRHLKKKYPEHADKIILLKEWKRDKQLSNPSIADPIGHEIGFFSDTFAEIHSELKRVLPHIFLLIKKFMSYQEISV